MKIETYLLFNGNCEAAFEFYAKCLNGKTNVMKYAGSPAEEHTPPGWGDKVLHAQVDFGDAILLGSDAPPDRGEKPQGFSVAYQAKDAAEAETVFNKLSEGGEIRMPFGKTFWSDGFGMFVDQFGIPWMINTDMEQHG